MLLQETTFYAHCGSGNIDISASQQKMSYLILFNEPKYISVIRYFDCNGIEWKSLFHSATFDAILVIHAILFIEDLPLYFCGQIKVIMPFVDRELQVSYLQDHQMDFIKICLMTHLSMLMMCILTSVIIIRYYQIRCTLKPPLKAASFVEVEQRQGYGSGKPCCTLVNVSAIFNLFSTTN